MPEHLELPFIPTNFNRPIRPGFGIKRTQRSAQEKQEFYRTSIEKFNDFQSSQSGKRTLFTGFFNPQLIFKIENKQVKHILIKFNSKTTVFFIGY